MTVCACVYVCVCMCVFLPCCCALAHSSPLSRVLFFSQGDLAQQLEDKNNLIADLERALQDTEERLQNARETIKSFKDRACVQVQVKKEVRLSCGEGSNSWFPPALVLLLLLLFLLLLFPPTHTRTHVHTHVHVQTIHTREKRNGQRVPVDKKSEIKLVTYYTNTKNPSIKTAPWTDAEDRALIQAQMFVSVCVSVFLCFCVCLCVCVCGNNTRLGLTFRELRVRACLWWFLFPFSLLVQATWG